MATTDQDNLLAPVVSYRPDRRVQLLLAYRWPLALVLSSAVLAAALLKILSQPIPIRIDGGGLNVDRLVMPSTVTIRADGPLPVQAGVVVDGDSNVKGEQPIQIAGPVIVRGAVDASVDGRVAATVDAIKTPIALDAPVQVVNEAPLQVAGAVTVEEPVAVEAKVDVKGKVGIDGKVGTRIGF